MSASSSSNRSRNQNRKKLVNEDASYIGPVISSSAGVKRQAVERIDESLSRAAKRKKVEPVNNVPQFPESEHRISMVDFVKMPSSYIHRYLSTFDLIPSIHPLPSSAEESQPPYSLGPGHHQLSRPSSPVSQPIAVPVTLANRPRRDQNSKDTRRRSSRLSEDDTLSFFHQRTPILADAHELHLVLASVAEKHFREMTPMNGREEVDTLAAFMFAVDGRRR